MRRIGLAVAALLPLCMPVSQALAAGCTTPQEDTAFLLLGLRTQLMETALTCQAQDKYNTFMAKFQPDLAAQEKVVSQYFRTRGGQKAHDNYVTGLANSESDSGLTAGNQICARNMPMFDELTWLHSSDELLPYVIGQDVSIPAEITDCTEAEPTTPVRHRVVHHARRK